MALISPAIAKQILDLADAYSAVMKRMLRRKARIQGQKS